MRTQITRAMPMSISRTQRNGKAALDRSAEVSDCRNSRERGPCTFSWP